MSTSFRASREYYRGQRKELARIGQENIVLVNIYEDLLCIILKDMEKENLGVLIKLLISNELE